jgi:DNA repair photolyase
MRGTDLNPTNRFLSSSYEKDGDYLDHEAESGEIPVSPKTQIIKDHTRTIITKNDSPDICFTHSLNPYRGCEHGCIYCFARPTHEYLGYSPGLDFETKILVKENAPELLREHFMSEKWTPDVVVMSGVTDCYQPLERKLEITRRCLQVFAEFRNPVALITKNYLITRDIDILQDLARDSAAFVNFSVTTLDNDLCNKMEPRTSRPAFRLKAIEALSKAGIPVRVMAAPLILGLTDSELPAILKAAKDAGAQFAAYTPVRLPYAVKDLFTDWLEKNYPEKKDKVLSQIRAIRGGKLNDSQFGSRLEGQGIYAENLRNLFSLLCKKLGLNETDSHLNTAAFRRPLRPGEQLKLF